jgi:NitT/TauT family transport system substrate-binding protein
MPWWRRYNVWPPDADDDDNKKREGTVRRIWSGVFAALICIGAVRAQAADTKPEKPNLVIGTASLGLTYLPLILAQQLGYFKDAGLTVEISAFPGGSKALEALMGGSVDVVSGAYSNTLTMAARGQHLIEFAEQVRCPGFVLGVARPHAAEFHSIADLKGMRVGVSAPGSSTHMVLNYLLVNAGLKTTDVSVIGVGSSSGTVAAVRGGSIDAVIDNDPALTILELAGDVRGVVTTRNPEDNAKVFGGPYPEASFYTKADFVKNNPNTIQAIANAVVRSEIWLRTATPEQVAAAVPKENLLGDRDLYIRAFTNMRACLSPDGLLEHDGAAVVLKVLATSLPNVRDAHINLDETFDDSFVQRALQTYH